MSEINLEIVEKVGVKVAAELQDNQDRWQELYKFLGVARVAQTEGWKLVNDPLRFDKPPKYVPGCHLGA